MPFYEYECTQCKFYVEVLQKISDKPLKTCPSCKKQTLKKLVSAPVFRLKGGGWYETDFKSDKEEKRNIAGREEAESKGEEAKAEGKEPAKAEGKEAAKAAPAATEGKGARASAQPAAASGKSKPKAKSPAKPKPRPKAKAAKKKGRR